MFAPGPAASCGLAEVAASKTRVSATDAVGRRADVDDVMGPSVRLVERTVGYQNRTAAASRA
jgi:hypothetical protein